ncbi:predicted protein [Plenodomus lingam JN3]|uniref:Predicted protein n=1 Tax=Leptosphaeria maculans (strain JN3 / isolate v23.1.3 / race Av1-4-5-6-7-8) TaxID=985895 RepID=E5R438_LEPMJ|nr:predicted protein [Plenodomus lingam JN3]CBX91815.1 predicted protein [Plenodomus lingam JN3]
MQCCCGKMQLQERIEVCRILANNNVSLLFTRFSLFPVASLFFLFIAASSKGHIISTVRMETPVGPSQKTRDRQRFAEWNTRMGPHVIVETRRTGPCIHLMSDCFDGPGDTQ